jgi:hypothetical protein
LFNYFRLILMLLDKVSANAGTFRKRPCQKNQIKNTALENKPPPGQFVYVPQTYIWLVRLPTKNLHLAACVGTFTYKSIDNHDLPNNLAAKRRQT